MSKKPEFADPGILPLPNTYKDALDYRQPRLIINSTESSDNEDKRNSGEISAVNNPVPKLPIDQS